MSCHCSCMAGLGESYSHAAATMFYIEAGCPFKGKEDSKTGACLMVATNVLKECRICTIKRHLLYSYRINEENDRQFDRW